MLRPSDLDDPWKGRWVAGQVRVSDEPPGPAIGMSPPTPISPTGGPRRPSASRTRWFVPSSRAPGFVAALEERGIRAEPGGDVRLRGAVELLADILAGGC